MDKIDTAVAAIIEKMNQFATTYGDEVTNLLLGAVQIKGLSTIVGHGVGLLVAALICKWAVSFAKKGYNAPEDKYGFTEDGAAGMAVVGTISFIISWVVAIVCLLEVVTVKHWVAIFEPKLWLALKVLDKVF